MTTSTDNGGGGLRIRGLHKHYGVFKAVDGIDLDVEEGRFYALLGPSGCGKTTTLRMVAGLEEPTAGQIMIGGQDISHLRPYQRPVNTVFQSYALFPHMTVFENIAFGLRRKKAPDIDKRVKEMLDLVEMGHLAGRKPSQLSGGQQQRIAVVRALVNKPKVLLLDEPLGALDLKLRRQMQLELKRIQNEVGITFIHVTHDQEEAMTMADTIAVLNKGKIEQLGAPVDLYENPRTAFVAGFLGQTNLLSVNVLDRSDDVIKVDFHGVQLAMPTRRMAATGTSVEAGVRPEKIQLARLGQAPTGMNAVDGRIIDVSFIGVSTQYVVRALADAEEELTVFSQNTETELWRLGDQVSAYWHPGHTFGLHEGAWKEAEAAEVASLSTAAAAAEGREDLAPPAPPVEPGSGRKKLTPYFLLLPGFLVLVVFFVLPLLTLLNSSLTSGGAQQGYDFTWAFDNYWTVWTEYWPQFLRSFVYAGTATILCILLSYPLAYTIAFKVPPKVRPFLLVLVIAPFLTSFLIRTLAWTTILADEGPVVSLMRNVGFLWLTDLIGLTSDDRVLATPLAVILGLAYNFLPFMTLPIYASLEKQDRTLVPAAGDLYASSWASFWKITWLLSLPGVVSGTLLTFIPAAGDYVNATFLGSVQQSMAGNVIESLFLRVRDYNHAAAMSISLTVGIVVLVIYYVRRAGTDDLV